MHTNLESSVDQVEEASRERAEAFLLNRINYEKTASIPYNERALKLTRMRELIARLGNPCQGIPIVHVAGTKGKGSTSAMISSILTHSGMRVGFFSSPHLEKIEERFRIDGVPCSGGELIALVDHIRPVVEAMDREAPEGETGPTYFELTTAIAMLHFQKRNANAIVLEVGLGGRLDATNVFQPILCVITSISLDHTQQLGSSVEQIASEKAGILKSGIPVIQGECNPGPCAVIEQKAIECGAPLFQLGKDFSFRYEPPTQIDLLPELGNLHFESHHRAIESLESVPLAWPGAHQAHNASLAVAAVSLLRGLGFTIGNDAIRAALAVPMLPARVEVVKRQPAVILDSAHNVASIEALVETLETSTQATRRTLIFATTQGKDVQGMVERLVPKFDRIFVTEYCNSVRAVPAERLMEFVLAAHNALPRESQRAGKIILEANPDLAWKAAMVACEKNELICITGSFFLAAELRGVIGE